MALEEVVQKATIIFPWDLTREQSRGLIKYITIKLRGLITYEFLHSIKIGYPSGYEVPLNEEKISNQKGVITLSDPPFISDDFQFKPSKKDESKLSAIQFHLTSDLKLEDYRPEVRQLWEDTRKAVEDYFEANPASESDSTHKSIST